MSELKHFIVKKNHQKLPNWFINFSRGRRYIWVVSCHIKPVSSHGITLHSSINHVEPYDDGFTAYCNEYFDKNRFAYKDHQMYEISLKFKDEDEIEIDIEEHDSYVPPKFRLELMLECIPDY
jgi:hypothetical protein